MARISGPCRLWSCPCRQGVLAPERPRLVWPRRAGGELFQMVRARKSSPSRLPRRVLSWLSHCSTPCPVSRHQRAVACTPTASTHFARPFASAFSSSGRRRLLLPRGLEQSAPPSWNVLPPLRPPGGPQLTHPTPAEASLPKAGPAALGICPEGSLTVFGPQPLVCVVALCSSLSLDRTSRGAGTGWVWCGPLSCPLRRGPGLVHRGTQALGGWVRRPSEVAFRGTAGWDSHMLSVRVCVWGRCSAARRSFEHLKRKPPPSLWEGAGVRTRELPPPSSACPRWAGSEGACGLHRGCHPEPLGPASRSGPGYRQGGGGVVSMRKLRQDSCPVLCWARHCSRVS